MISLPFLLGAAKTAIAFAWQPALVGATVSATAHVVTTPSDELTLSGTLREATIGATTSIAGTGILSGTTAALNACSQLKNMANVIQAGKQVADVRAVQAVKRAAAHVATLVESHPQVAQTAVDAFTGMGTTVVNCKLRDVEVTGTTLLKAAMSNSMMGRFEDVNIPAASKPGVASAVVQAMGNVIDDKPLLEGTGQAFVVSTVSSQMIAEANEWVDATKPDKKSPDFVKHVVTKAVAKGTIDGHASWLPEFFSRSTVSTASCPPVEQPQMNIQPVRDLLVRYQKAFGITDDHMEKFLLSLHDLQEGQFQVYHASFSEQQQGIDHSIYLFVKRQGDTVFSRVYKREFPGKIFSDARLIKSKL